MKKALNKYLVKKMEGAFSDSYSAVNKIIKEYVDSNGVTPKVLDLGSSSGAVTKKYLKGVKTNEIHGLDVLKPTKNKDIIFTKCNIEGAKFPFKAKTFDVVISGQTIEHLLNKDLMISESHRVLKPGGLFVCATENIASFDNIISLILGQEPQTQTTGNIYHTSSFLSPNFMKKVGPDGNKYMHKNVTSYYGLQRLCRVNGFENINIKSFGNLFKFLEYLFPVYNRVTVVYGTK